MKFISDYCDYIKKRFQGVNSGTEFNYDSIVKVSMSQSTVLGPLLFLVYINSVT